MILTDEIIKKRGLEIKDGFKNITNSRYLYPNCKGGYVFINTIGRPFAVVVLTEEQLDLQLKIK